jgi:hypothetical protein
MPANFLIVCGGAGRGILHNFDTLGFNGALQIDVQSELVQTSDMRILQVGLPIGYGAPAFDDPAIMADYLQRLEVQWQAHHAQAAHAGDHHACQMGECPDYHRQRNHAHAVMNTIPPSKLRLRMTAPLIMRAYATHPRFTDTIARALVQLRAWMSHRQDQVTVWLIASTCGAMGNGIVHHVADVVKAQFGDLQLKIKFIRIGSLSYRSIVQNADIATFWSVLTDYGYKNNHKQKTVKLAEQGINYATTQEFYYIDLPDVAGETQQREQLVQSAFVAFANPDIDKVFVTQLNNFGGVVFARVGEWGNTFDKSAVYHLTLRQLKQKLDALLQPRDAAAIAEVQSFNIKEVSSLNTDEVRTRCTGVANDTKNEAFLTSLASIGNEFNTINNINALQSHPKWQLMRDVVAKIFDEPEVRAMRREVQMSMVINNETVNIDLGGNFENVNDRYVASVDHIQRIRTAQRAKAKLVQHLLGNADIKGHINTVLRDKWNGLIAVKKMKTGFAVFDDLLIENKDRQGAFNAGINTFLQEYFKVARCLEILEETESIIEDVRKRLRNVVFVVDREIQNTAANVPHEYMNCAELEDTFGANETWLKLLVSATYGEISVVEIAETFRQVVELGASGLTEDGLKYVLGVHPASSNEQIVDAVNTTVGANNAVWWQGIAQPKGWRTNHGFDIRRFPRLKHHIFEVLQRENNAWEQAENKRTPLYICNVSQAMGLDIYAVQGAIPGINEEEQIVQLTEQVCRVVVLDYERYHQEGSFDKKEYIATQCTHSIGLPIRVPPALMNHPNIKEIMTIMTDYLVIDQS